jgi:hypothetical protein
MAMNGKIVSFVIGLLIVAVGTASADDRRILDVLLKKGIITQAEYAEILKEAAEEPKPPAKSETKPSVADEIQQAVEAQKAAEKQQGLADKQAVKEGQERGWLGALKDGFTPRDTEYQPAPASTMLLHLRRQERIGFHLHNIQAQYFDQPDLSGATGTTKSQFKINSAELEVSGYLLPGLLYAQVVVDARDTAGRGLGDSIAKNIPPGNNAPQGILRDAFADLVLKEPEAVIRGGQQRIPFGIENQTPGGLLPFINRSFIDFKTTRNPSPDNTRFSNAEFNQERDIGVQARGRLWGDYFDYALGVFNGAGINVSDTNSSKDAIGRLGFNPHPGLRFGVSGYRGTQVDILKESGVRNRVAGDFELTHDLIPRLHIMGEVADGKDMGQPISFHRLAWYVQAMFEIIPQRTPTSPMLLVKYRYDEFRDNLGVGDNNYTRSTVGLDYYFLNAVKISSGYWQQLKFQLEYEIRRHTATSLAGFQSDAFGQNMIIGQLAVRY